MGPRAPRLPGGEQQPSSILGKAGGRGGGGSPSLREGTWQAPGRRAPPPLPHPQSLRVGRASGPAEFPETASLQAERPRPRGASPHLPRRDSARAALLWAGMWRPRGGPGGPPSGWRGCLEAHSEAQPCSRHPLSPRPRHRPPLLGPLLAHTRSPTHRRSCAGRGPCA